MSRLSHALFGASALALVVLPAAAQTGPVLRGSVSGQYGNVNTDAGDANTWTGGGSITAGIAQGINIQGDLGYSTIDPDGGGSADVWTFGGSVFYRAPQFAFGANIGRTNVDLNPGDFNVTNYGAFGEFYANEMFTLYANGGWLDGDFNTDGSYIGGGVRVYPMPNLGLTGSLTHNTTDGGDANQYGVRAEYMFSAMMPISVYGGYDRVDFDGSTDANVWTIGLRFQFGGPEGTLVERDRTGPIRSAAGLITQF
jgi:hypothetical protein